MSKIPDISFSWSEGRYFDLWSLVHSLSGITLGFIIAFLQIQTVLAYTLAFVIIVLWEVFEKSVGIHETKENRVLDIVVGMIFFVVAYKVSDMIQANAQESLTIFSVLVLAFLTLIGWLDYRKRQRR